jgi:hypothetical protein
MAFTYGSSQEADLIAEFGGLGVGGRSSISPDANGKPILQTPSRNDNKTLVPGYVYVDPNGVNFKISDSLGEVIELYQKDFNNNPEYYQSILDKLKIKKNANPTDRIAALNKYLIDYGTGVVAAYKTEPTKGLVPLSKWTGGTGSSVTTVERALSTKTQASQDLDDFFFQQLGRKATLEEKKDFYNRLRKEESVGVTTTTGQTSRTSVGRGLTSVDRQRIMGDVLRPAADLMTGDELLKSGGLLGTYISKLQATARSYGLAYSSDMAKKNVLSNYQSGGTLTTGSLDAEELTIKTMAKTMYPNLGKLIDTGVKVSSLADQYAYYMGQTLELPDNSIDITRDTYIQNALKNGGQEGSMNLNDFQLSLRKDARWAKTKNAREEASSYVNSILSSFGLVR